MQPLTAHHRRRHSVCLSTFLAGRISRNRTGDGLFAQHSIGGDHAAPCCTSAGYAPVSPFLSRVCLPLPV
jgi:hypothetical protein